MKKLATTLITSALVLGTTSAVFALDANPMPTNNMGPNQPYPMAKIKKPLNLTSNEAETLVQARLIKCGKAKTESIGKIDTVKLSNNKTFYIVYAGVKGQSQADQFFVVDGQNGHVSAYPKGKFKMHHKHLPNQAMNYGYGHHGNHHMMPLPPAPPQGQ